MMNDELRIKNIEKLQTNGKFLFLAYDQGLEHGPIDFDEKNVDPSYILDIAVNGQYNAVVLQKGVAEKYYATFKDKIPLVVKLNGKTNLRQNRDESYSSQVCSVAEAVELGAVGVGYTMYIGSKYEHEMLEEFGKITKEATEKNLVKILWSYPRGKDIDDESDPDITAYAARVGLETGADIVKIRYPGSKEALKWAVKAAGNTKVVVSGGLKVSENEFVDQLKAIKDSGAAGIAVGRNVWQAEDPMKITKKIKDILLS